MSRKCPFVYTYMYMRDGTGDTSHRRFSNSLFRVYGLDLAHESTDSYMLFASKLRGNYVTACLMTSPNTLTGTYEQ